MRIRDRCEATVAAYWCSHRCESDRMRHQWGARYFPPRPNEMGGYQPTSSHWSGHFRHHGCMCCLGRCAFCWHKRKEKIISIARTATPRGRTRYRCPSRSRIRGARSTAASEGTPGCQSGATQSCVGAGSVHAGQRADTSHGETAAAWNAQLQLQVGMRFLCGARLRERGGN